MTVVVSDVKHTYVAADGKEVVALDGIDLEVLNGEFVSVIGPSGCGKSTLLHCIGGVVRPIGGEIYRDGAMIRHPSPQEAAFVFQDYSLLPWKTVVDNVAIGLKFAGVKRAVRRGRAVEALERMGLSGTAARYPRELSGGMQQRVAVARALVMEPDMLLMDEPFGAVDEISRRRLGVDIAARLSVAGKAVIMVTHSIDEAVFWADRVVVMSAQPGRLAKVVSVAEPRPRSKSFFGTSEFAELRADILAVLDVGG